MAENKVRIVIAADGSAAITGIGKVSGSLGEFEKKSGGIGASIRRHWLGISAAVVSAYLTISKSFSFVEKSIELANAQEEAEKRLTVALGYRSQALIDQATAIQSVTTYEDDAVIGAQAMIAMFVKDEAQIKKATEATLDLAAAKGMNLKNAADLVSKTLGSSTNALSRYGIEVTGAVGSTERLESTVNNISRVFGGQAAVAADTYGGKVVMLKNAWGDMKEELGNAVTQNRFMIETTGILKSAVQDLTVWIRENKTVLMEMVRDAVLWAVDAFVLLIEIIDKAAAAWRHAKASHTDFAETLLIMDGSIVAAEKEATEAVLAENKKKDESWKALIDRLEKMREKIAAVNAESVTAPVKKAVSRVPGVPGAEGKAEVPDWMKALEKARFEEAKAYDEALIAANEAWRKWELDQIRERIKEEQEAAERRLGLEQEIYDIRREQAEILFTSRVATAQEALGAIGGGEIAANVGMLLALQEGQDPYQQEYDRWAQLQDQKIMRLEELGATETQLRDYYREYDLRQEETQQQQKIAMAANTFGMMANVASAFYAASGSRSKEAFRLMQAMRIGETVMNTYSAAVGAYNAMASIPIVGPALGAAAAAAAIAFGMAQVKAIAAMKPGGGPGSVTLPSAGGRGTLPVEAPRFEEEKEVATAPKIINIHVYGNIVDHDQFARELIPALTKAEEDGAR